MLPLWFPAPQYKNGRVWLTALSIRAVAAAIAFCLFVLLRPTVATATQGDGIVSVHRKEYQINLAARWFNPQLFVGARVVLAELHNLVNGLGPHTGAVEDMEGRDVPYELISLDTSDRSFRKNGIVLRMKVYRDFQGVKGRHKYYLVFKVNSLDPDTLFPPLSNPTAAYTHSCYQKIEQDIHQYYTKFGQSTQVWFFDKPHLERVADLRTYFQDVQFDFVDWEAPLLKVESFYVWRRTDMKVKLGDASGQAVLEVYFRDKKSPKALSGELSLRIASRSPRHTRAAHTLFQKLLVSKLNTEREVKCALNIGPLEWPSDMALPDQQTMARLREKPGKGIRQAAREVSGPPKGPGIEDKTSHVGDYESESERETVLIFAVAVACAFGLMIWWYQRQLRGASLPFSSHRRRPREVASSRHGLGAVSAAQSAGSMSSVINIMGIAGNTSGPKDM